MRDGAEVRRIECRLEKTRQVFAERQRGRPCQGGEIVILKKAVVNTVIEYEEGDQDRKPREQGKDLLVQVNP